MKRHFAVLVALVTILACGGGGAGTPVIAIPDAQREAVLQSLTDQFEQIVHAGGTVDSQIQAIASVMAGMPEFEAAGHSSEFGSAWGRFTDGRLLIVGNNGFPSGAPGAPIKRSKASFIAKSGNARLGHAFGSNFPQLQNPINDMARYLQVDGSYQITSPPEGKLRLSDLRAVSGDAFVYFNAHGGEGTTKSNQTVFIMASSTPQDAATDALPEVKADWDADRLAYYIGETGVTVGGVRQTAKTYAINSKFVKDYMSFGSNAIVFLNVCYTANPHLAVAEFRNAFLSKGAGVVLGWTQLCNSSSAFDAARYFVDRLVAKNDFETENPLQRAFSTSEILADMSGKGKDKDGNSQLKATFGASVSNVGLRPTIRYMFREEVNDYLVLTGEFGSEPGRVLVNNVPATVVGTWGSSTLLTRIPASGNGSEGPVVVEVHDKKSKPRYLTSWRGTYTYNYVDPSLRSTLTESATVNIHIRADIDVYRQNPGEVPQDQPFRSFFAAADSSLNWACSGTLVDAQNVVIVRWTGGGNPPHSFSSPTTPSAKWICSGAFDPVLRRLTLSIFNGGPKSEFKFGVGTSMVFPQSSSAYDKILNADWSGPALDLSSPNTTSKWSAFAVSSVPPMAGYYRP